MTLIFKILDSLFFKLNSYHSELRYLNLFSTCLFPQFSFYFLNSFNLLIRSFFDKAFAVWKIRLQKFNHDYQRASIHFGFKTWTHLSSEIFPLTHGLQSVRIAAILVSFRFINPLVADIQRFSILNAFPALKFACKTFRGDFPSGSPVTTRGLIGVRLQGGSIASWISADQSSFLIFDVPIRINDALFFVIIRTNGLAKRYFFSFRAQTSEKIQNLIQIW